MGFRSLVRRLAKPAAMVGVVGMLSLSLIVTTPSNAQAFSNGDELLKAAPRIQGAIKTIAPVAGTVAAVATSVTPLGWALKGGYTLLMLGMSTQDLWMPYVTGTFGQPPSQEEAGDTAPNGSAYNKLEGFDLGGPNGAYTVTLPRTLTMNWLYTGTKSTSTTAHINTDFQCRQTVAQTGKPVGTVFRFTFDWTVGGVSTTNKGGSLTGGACPTNSEILYGSMGPSTASQYNGIESFFYYGGDPARQGFDPRSPDVGYQGRSECIDSAGVVSWIEGPVISGAAGGVQMPSCEAAGKGHGTGRTKVIAFKPDGTQTPVWDVPVAPSDPSTPLCDPGLASSGCTLQVTKDDKPCVSGDVECENWASEKSKDPSRWKCKFGPYTLPLTACNLLEQAYRIGGAIATDANTDGDPATRDDNDYSGQPVPQPAPGAVAAPAPGAPAPGTVPGAGGQLGPGADEKTKECFPTGWGMLNPVEWVMKPVGCALEAAFVPKKDVQARLAGMQSQFANKVPVSWFGVGVEGVSGGACPANWAVTFEGHTYSLICGTAADDLIRGFRPVLGSMLIMAMLWPLIRSLFYAAIPVFKVTPS